MRMLLTSNYAAAYAVKLAKVDIVAAYPITPQTQVVEKLAEFIERGLMRARMIRVESEHSAMAACIGGSAVGARVFTATSSQGLLYMYEMLWWASGARLPIVMGVVSRAIAPPWSIWADHSDILSMRDSGWIIFFAENAQEVLDTIVQAYRIAEDEKVLLPVAVGWDAFTSSHTAEPVELPEEKEIESFLPERPRTPFVLSPSDPSSHGNLAYPEDYFKFRYAISESMKEARRVIIEVGKKYAKLTGREYGLMDKYRCEDADIILITMGSMAGDAKDAVDVMRDEGYKVGLIKLRCLRPFPKEELGDLLKRVKGVGVVERSFSMGRGGVISVETASALTELGIKDVTIISYIAGLGGKDVGMDDFVKIFLDLQDKCERGASFETIWYGMKEGM